MRDVARQIDVIKGRAAIRAAEVHADGYVTHTAMHTVAEFSATEESLAEKHPLATTRLQILSDAGTMRIAQRVRDW